VDTTDDTIYMTRIELSADGESWTPVRTWFEPDDRRALIERPRDVRWYEARFEPIVARYVRLTNARARYRGQRWEIGELEIFTRAGAPSASAAPDLDAVGHRHGMEAGSPE
jgi:hypothetical protein